MAVGLFHFRFRFWAQEVGGTSCLAWRKGPVGVGPVSGDSLKSPWTASPPWFDSSRGDKASGMPKDRIDFMDAIHLFIVKRFKNNK